MTHITCRLTAKNRDQLWNPTLGNRVWATFTFFAVTECDTWFNVTVRQLCLSLVNDSLANVYITCRQCHAMSQHTSKNSTAKPQKLPHKTASQFPETRSLIYKISDSTNTHKPSFNGPFSGITQVSRYQKGKTNLNFTEARQWVAVASAGPYASLHLAPDRQPRQHLTTLFFYGPDGLPAAQPTVSKHWISLGYS